MNFVKKDNYEIEIAVLSASVRTGLSEENVMTVVALAIMECEKYKNSQEYDEKEILDKVAHEVGDTLNVSPLTILIVLKEFSDGLTEAKELKGEKVC